MTAIPTNYSNKDKKQIASKSKRKRNSIYFVFLFIAICLSVIIAYSLAAGSYASAGNTVTDNSDSDININTNEKAPISKDSRIIKEIQGTTAIGQMPELPSGCEITALAMLLNWSGLNIDKQDLARAIPKESVPVLKSGVLRGGNPNMSFVGDPFSGNGFGVYHKPIAALINKYLPDKSEDITGKTFEDILKIIDSGRPLVVWATVDMKEPRLYTSWYDRYGAKVKWMGPEHAFLLVGYSDTDVIVNDPYTGRREYYPIPLFKNRWETMGKQAVTVRDSIKGNVVTTVISKTPVTASP